MSDNPQKSKILYERAPATVLYRDRDSDIPLRPKFSEIFNANELKDIVAAAEPGEAKQTTTAVTKLGWFEGAFVPCLLNIWGVIMFLRLGWVVGEAGVLLGACIIILSHVITGITALSLFAICTNGEVKGGGAYFLISRSLGPIYGGVIGILFFLAQAVASAMYVIGFSDAIIDMMVRAESDPFTGTIENDGRVIGVATMIALLGVALTGVGWYAKCQIFLLIALIIALSSVVIGAFIENIPDEWDNAVAGFIGFDGAFFSGNYSITHIDPSVLLPAWTADPITLKDHSFFTVFSVFFPAVTGIMAGANMSGDLKDPSHDIPVGTSRAMFVTFWSYLLLVVVLGYCSVRCADIDMGLCPLPEDQDLDWANAVSSGSILGPVGGLVYNKLIMVNISLYGPLVYIGVIAATLSSALASIVGAPRILQSLASDKIFPWASLTYFAQGVGPDNEPKRGYVLTFVVGTLCCLIGKLDIIAPIISNFFMISYAMTNYACFAAEMSQSPGWRPSFKYYNKWLSLLGAVLCVACMFAMDWVNSLISSTLGMALYVYLKYVDPDTNWGPVSEARKYYTALRSMERLQRLKYDNVKSFRPQFQILCQRPQSRSASSLVNFAQALSHGHGVTVIGCVLVPENADSKKEEDKESTQPNVAARRHQVIKANTFRKECYNHFYQNVTNKHLSKSGFFVDVVSAPDLHAGFCQLMQLGGLGRLRPNTLVLGWKKDWISAPVEEVARYEQVIFDTLLMDKAAIIIRDNDDVFCDKNLQVKEGQVDDVKNAFSVDLEKESLMTTRTMSQGPGSFATDGEQKTVRNVDVWWLSDDGGLTILLPHLLRKHKTWEDTKMRFVSLSGGEVSLEGLGKISAHATKFDATATVRLESHLNRAARLISKLRFDATPIVLDAALTSKPSQASMTLYKALCDKVGISPDLGDETATDEDFLPTPSTITICLTELLRQHSMDSHLVFVMLPATIHDICPKRYMTWLEFMSNNMPSTIFLRGSGEEVVTLYT